jgi:hypothetical protein
VITTTGRAIVQVSVHVTAPCFPEGNGYMNVRLVAVNPGQDVESAYLDLTNGTNADGLWTGTMSFSRTTNVGLWSADVVISQTTYAPVYSTSEVRNVRQDSFWVRRDTHASATVAPRPASAGQVLQVRGHVARLTVGLKYVAWRHHDVKVYFRRAGHHARHLVTTVRTNNRGRFTARVPATHTGRWYVLVPGSTANAPRWTAGLRVRVM